MNKAAKQIIILVTAIILLFIFVVPGFAQSPIMATVDRNTLSTDDTLTLTVTVSAEGQPVIPGLAGFNVLGSGTLSQISIVNGSMNSSIIYNYHLQPNQTGPLTIGPVSLTVNGQTYSTQPITVQVSQGTGKAQPAPSRTTSPAGNLQSFFNSAFPSMGSATGRNGSGTSLFDDMMGSRGGNSFVEATVSNPTPYVGEPVVYTFRYYQDSDDLGGMLDQPQYAPPDFAGFWAESDNAQNQYRAQGNGHIYNVTELVSVLVPSKMGEIVINEAYLTTTGGFFNSGSQIAADPITVNVQPLPANSPANFSGGVGQFTIEAKVDTPQTKVNEPITWKVTVAGQGNINTVSDPVWPDISGWRSFESAATVNSQIQEGQLAGSREYERLLVPETEGEFIIPALEYSYFDPAANQYQTISTQPIPVSIAPANPGSLNAQAGTSTLVPLPEVGEKEIVEQLANDIRYLKPVPSQLSRIKGPMTESPLYWLAWGIPLVGLVGNFVWQRRKNFWQNNAGLAQSSQAGKKAKRALTQAQKQKDDIYSTAGQILYTYLADKLNQPVVGLTHQSLASLLTVQGLGPELIERVQVCLDEAELGRFSPDAGHPDHAGNLLKEIDILIGDLEKGL